MKTQLTIATQIDAGRLDLKFAYLGKEGAQRHVAHSQSAGYQAVSSHAALSHLAADLNLSDLRGKTVDLVDFGSGSGVVSSQVLRVLQGAGLNIARAVLVDVSPDLLTLAKKHVAHAHPGISIDTHVTDLEVGHDPDLPALLARNDADARLHLLLGGMLGNVHDPARVCRAVAGYCEPADRFIVNVSSADEARKDPTQLRDYNSENFLAGVMSPLRDLEIPPERIRGETVYEDDERAYVTRVRFTDTVICSAGGREWLFPKGKTVEVFRSRRFASGELARFLTAEGWEVIWDQTVDAKSWACAKLTRPA
ncbi:L-histidine N(alpha)-methyltransferase [Roseobacter sp. YSTF-M11]|uniref:L-histidine N(Alpha)-methyltransferase n=1 Tax=Roseobacter insulae TaxID=2859783 RepID=A0A9X1JZ53_9RHOB|nr:L-histidine N(alpha)-methyltransferase [Roseobacter insulae]MBW4708991.1 L-histidine N(alpha)-methyltransferase [Roseobacter insulae]